MSFLESGCVLALGQDLFLVGQGKVDESSEPLDREWAWYTPDFFLDDPRPWKSYAQCELLSRETLCQRLESEVGSSLQPHWIPPEYESFSTAFQSLKKHFSEGTLKKGVPVVFETAPVRLDGKDRAWLLLQLLRRTLGVPLWIYGTWDSEGGILGATPELLFRRDSAESEVETVALAGTRFKSTSNVGSNVGALLLQDPKEREEHQWVIHGISEALREVGEVRVGETGLLELPTLFHLHTPIRVRTQASFLDLVRRMHPTPALGAFPREAGWKWLREFAGSLERGRFGAPFGVLRRTSKGEVLQSLCVVGIRNLQWGSNQIRIGAGCGVVQASQLDREWAEVQGKIGAIKRVFWS